MAGYQNAAGQQRRRLHEERIDIIHMTKDYGYGKGIFDVSLTVEEGETFGYLGPNGAGKTTTIRQLMGFIQPDDGKCQILGMDCFEYAPQIQKDQISCGEIAFMNDMKGPEILGPYGGHERGS